MAGLAGALLGWRPDEFWSATPAELGAIVNAMAGEEIVPASAADLALFRLAKRGGKGIPCAVQFWATNVSFQGRAHGWTHGLRLRAKCPILPHL